MVREIDTRNFGINRDNPSRAADLSKAVASASNKLPASHAVEYIGINSLTGAPNLLRSINAQPADRSLIEQALEHVGTVTEALGFTPGEPAEFIPDPTIWKTSSGSSAVHLHQHYRGVPVFDMIRTVRFSPQGEVDDVVGDNADIPKGISISPEIRAAQAVMKAAQYITDPTNQEEQAKDGWGEPIRMPPLDISSYNPKLLVSFPLPSQPSVMDKGPFGDLIPAHLVLFYRGSDTVLGWYVVLALPSYSGQFALIVSAGEDNPGEILYCRNTMFSARASGNVYEENPGQTPRRVVCFPRPIDDYRLPVPDPLPAELKIFPHDWVSDDESSGNSVCAVLRPMDRPLKGMVENDIIHFDSASETGDDQKVLNIFYFCNYMHDFFYLLGFDEAAGNFQVQNYSGKGSQNDPVLAYAHSGQVRGTANMSTPPDGHSAIMNMGLLGSTGRHTAFDADVVFHEYVHGVTNRLVGGCLNTNALQADQSKGMGEGWSDYFALTIQNCGKAAEKVVVGDWVAGNPGGIRKFPYDNDFPDHFGKVGKGRYREEHNIGEIWCATLVQMNRNLGNEFGSAEKGHQIGWQIVVDALKLTPSNPSFLDARDAIIKALVDLRSAGLMNEADHKKALRAVWRAFYRFRMGLQANCNGPSFQGIAPDPPEGSPAEPPPELIA